MTDKTREDFERWAFSNDLLLCGRNTQNGYQYQSPMANFAWQAYQQGLADARKPSTETAAEWIGRHEQIYRGIKGKGKNDVNELKFRSTDPEDSGDYALIGDSTGCSQFINLETASDCIKLCELLRVTPVERGKP